MLRDAEFRQEARRKARAAQRAADRAEHETQDAREAADAAVLRHEMRVSAWLLRHPEQPAALTEHTGTAGPSPSLPTSDDPSPPNGES